jgi:NADPH:quinone reductase-like Zn-dependent oxidoreductase
MRAVVYDRYGPPEVLRIEDLPKPAPAAGQVLVRIAATSVNLSDWEMLRETHGPCQGGGAKIATPTGETPTKQASVRRAAARYPHMPPTVRSFSGPAG